MVASWPELIRHHWLVTHELVLKHIRMTFNFISNSVVVAGLELNEQC